MEFEFWYLILVPALFAAGWWARGLERRDQKNNEEAVPEAYARAVALLMGSDPEGGIEALVDVARNDPDMVELHQVLGLMFRRRGEFEKAIRLHRHLAERSDVDEATHRLALRSLAEDYLQAGLFGRAEAVYRELSQDPTEYLGALKALLGIYVTEHDWTQAVDVATKLEKQAGEDHAVEIAHFYCELAEIAVKRKDVSFAADCLGRALDKNPQSVRARIALGALAASGGDVAEALRQWRGVLDEHPEYAPLVVGRIADAMKAAGDEDGALAFLREASEKDASPDVLITAIERLVAWHGQDKAVEFTKTLLKAHPSLLAFSVLTGLKAKEEGASEETVLLGRLLERYARSHTRYQCAQCGFMASSFAWHCLGCGAWDSFPAYRELENKARSGY